MAGGLKQFLVSSFEFLVKPKTRNQKRETVLLKFNSKLILVLFALLSGSALAETDLPDPTQPPAGVLLPAEDAGGSAPQGGPILQSVLISPRYKSAIISGKTYVQGDKLGEATVVKISETEVVLQDRENKQVLSLFPSTIKKSLVVTKSPKKAASVKK